MKLSLIIPIYNAENDLPELFQSITAQARPFDEVILIDNNSQDNSKELCEDFQKKNQTLNIMLLDEKMPGPGPARNKGIHVCNGESICFTDADCVLEKDFAKNVEDFFLKNEKADIIGGTAVNNNPLSSSKETSLVEEFSTFFWSGERASARAYPLNKKEDFFSSVPSYITTYNMACRKKVLDALKGFEEIKTMEDIDFWLRACEAGFSSVGGLPEIRVFHKNRTSLKSLCRQYYNYTLSLPWLLKKHFQKQFVFGWQMKKVFSFSLFTGYFEINPHTLLLPILIIKASFFPYALMLVLLYKYVTMTRRLFYAGNKHFISKGFLFTCIMEARKLSMSAGAIMGSLHYKILCIL